MQIGRRHVVGRGVTGGPITTTNYATNGTHLDVRRFAGSAGPERRTTHPGLYDCSAIKHRHQRAQTVSRLGAVSRPKRPSCRCCYRMSLLLVVLTIRRTTSPRCRLIARNRRRFAHHWSNARWKLTMQWTPTTERKTNSTLTSIKRTGE